MSLPGWAVSDSVTYSLDRNTHTYSPALAFLKLVGFFLFITTSPPPLLAVESTALRMAGSEIVKGNECECSVFL